MSLYVVTQIKKQVDEAFQANQKQYSVNRQKKQLKYYSLHLKQVVKIQTYFRKYLVKKTKSLEEEVSLLLKRKQYLYREEKKLDIDLKSAKLQRSKLRNSHLNKMVQSQKQNISSNARFIIKNVVNCADNYARNAALSRISINQLASMHKQENQLRAEIKQLQLQNQCYEQRIASWNEKLNELRSKIIYESSVKNQLQDQFESCA